MIDPRLTVTMSVFNDAAYLSLAIESILTQTFEDFEFLIVNDGSTDDSGMIIDRFAKQDRRIRAIHQANHGLIYSLNLMIAQARAPLIGRMDGDDIALPTRFDQQVAYLDAHPEIGVLGTGADTIDERGRPGLRRFDNVTDPDAVVADLKNGPPLCHPSVVMRRDVVRSVGGYHAAFLHCEDYDLWLRLSEVTRLTSLPERLILYRQSASQVSNRHALTQQIGAAVAWEAHVERIAKRPDPTDNLNVLPPIHELDALFRRPGTSDNVREKTARGILYSPTAMRGEGFALLLEQVKGGARPEKMWRTVARLTTFGAPIRAFRLAWALLRRQRSSSKNQLAI
ncbi:glycosyltransferase [Sphingomonas paeninsulae]|jgi:GT2 family glycosyltransferase|uniref:Glycosyltransferase n=1 Tax=Sphingomonas paeninsulae TaxID=2319844 RepID=A0A494TBG7_SPHPE|nr:glycosyltransferase [Sphingomonas paeninsulae]AYJ86789.1 glycosyltransferase [Sphingomonas paeninsulae]